MMVSRKNAANGFFRKRGCTYPGRKSACPAAIRVKGNAP